MAGAQVVAFPSGSQLNGHLDDRRPDTPSMLEQLSQFDRIVKLREEVASGTHPTLKFSSATLAAISSENGAASVPSPANLPAQSTSSLPQAGSANQTGATPVLSSGVASERSNQQAASQTQVPKVSDFDPILLTKSEPLKRAELRIERQRVEKRVEEQINRKRMVQKRETEQDSLPDFDVSDALIQAQELVKPLSASEITVANDNNSASNSIDDNTFYSSQHNESENEDRADLRATKPCRFFFEGKCLKGSRCDWSHDPAFRSKMQPTGDEYGYDQEGYASGGRRPRRPSPSYGPRDPDSADQAMEDGEINEGSYSPPHFPPPVAEALAAMPSGAHDLSGQSRQNGTARRPAVEERPPHVHERKRSGRHSPVMGEGQVIQNHITSPAAPQPARVSPLAVAKLPRLERVRQDVDYLSPKGFRQPQNYDESSGSAQFSAPRKRQRRPSLTEAGRNVAQRRNAESPEPYIKPEPISPAPPGGIPARDIAPPAEPRSPVYYRQVATTDNRIVYEEVRPERIPVEQPIIRRIASPMDRRVMSGPGGSYELRREPELRRIVSARQQLRAFSPQLEYERLPQEPQGAVSRSRAATPQREYYAQEPDYRRPMSRAYILPEAEPPVAYRASVQPQGPVAYSRPPVPRSPPSPGFVATGSYGTSPREPLPRAAGPRTVVVDKYGNQYYESTTDYAPIRRGSVAPEPRAPREMGPPKVPSRASVHPEATRPYEERYAERTSPEPTSPTYVELREAQPRRAPSQAPSRAPVIYERTKNGEYGPVAEYPHEYAPRYEEIPPPSRMGPGRAASMAPPRPVYADERESLYERSYRVPTAQPEIIRYSEVPRGGTVARQPPLEREERIEYREPPRPVYHYVEGPSDPYARSYGAPVYVDEHGRRLQ